MTINIIDLLILFLCTLVLYRAFHEWLKIGHPLMMRAIFIILVPSYAFIVMTTTVEWLIDPVTPNVFLSTLKRFSSKTFIYTGILYGIFLLHSQRKVRGELDR